MRRLKDEMTWWNTIVKYEQHFLILNFGWMRGQYPRKYHSAGMVGNRISRGEELFRPHPQSRLSGKREDPGVEGETSRWLHISRWPPKGTQELRYQEVSYLYSVDKILSEFRTPCTIFTSTRPSKLRSLGSRMIERALAEGLFKPFNRGRGIHWYYWKNIGPSCSKAD